MKPSKGFKARDFAEPQRHESIAVTDLTWQGEGVCRINGQVAFVPGGIPGDVLTLQVCQGKKGILECQILEIQQKSPRRVEPPCPFFQRCGGCQIMCMDYRAQLDLKARQLLENMERIGGLKNARDVFSGITGMEFPWRYRNKAIFHVSGPPLEPEIGLFGQASRQVVDINDCLIQSTLASEYISLVRELLIKGNSLHCNEQVIPGVDFRRILIRTSSQSGKVLLEAVLGKGCPSWLESSLHDTFMSLEEPPASLYVSFQDPQARGTGIPEKHLLLGGEETISEKMENLLFNIGPDTFFQVNPLQARHLVNHVIGGIENHCSQGVPDTLIDLYCGVGFFGLSMAGLFNRVIGIESNPRSVAEALANAQRNGMDNVRFMEGDAQEIVKTLGLRGILGSSGKGPVREKTAILLDPPRTGCGSGMMKSILAMEPELIMMVSCNPSTLARDCQTLCRGSFRLVHLAAVDMFPHTMHLESVAILSSRR